MDHQPRSGMNAEAAIYPNGRQLWQLGEFPRIPETNILQGEGMPHLVEPVHVEPADLPPVEAPDNRMVLSVRQPWAWLIVNGIKDVENRTRHTAYTGDVWIQAGDRIEREMIAVLRGFGYCIPDRLQTGGIVGRTRIISSDNSSRSEWYNGKDKAWILDTSASRPVPFQKCRGFLGLFPAGRGY